MHSPGLGGHLEYLLWRHTKDTFSHKCRWRENPCSESWSLVAVYVEIKLSRMLQIFFSEARSCRYGKTEFIWKRNQCNVIENWRSLMSILWMKLIFLCRNLTMRRSQWPSPADVCLLGLRVRIPLGYGCLSRVSIAYFKAGDSGFGGLEVACWPLIPKFAGSNPTEAVGFFRAKKS